MGNLEGRKGEKNIKITPGYFCNTVNEPKLMDLFIGKG